MNLSRFDLIRGSEGKFLLSEIELIAPRLFLQYSDTALSFLIECIRQEIGNN
jgi:hypothetical protein